MSETDEIMFGLVQAMAENEGVNPEDMENLDLATPEKVLASGTVKQAIEDEENGH